MWVLAQGTNTTTIPAFALTGNKAEIDFLRSINRIPDSLAFVYDEEVKVWGAIRGGFGGMFLVEAHGLYLLAYAEGTSPAAINGNAVIFDQANADRTWSKPFVFDAAKKPLVLKPTCLYYCISDGDRPAFECIDLVDLKILK